ncbi:MAG: sulfatase [Myxococcota bacterium]|nr:sulfatase [Myxococcota bacterium]
MSKTRTLRLFFIALLLGQATCYGPFQHRSESEQSDELHFTNTAEADAADGEDKAKGLILITVDTLRADMLGTYGHPEVQTPTFDRLAEEGQLFKTAIAQSSTTTPSHASLFTSLYLHDHNVYSNFEALGRSPPTIAQLLQEQGYETFAMVNMRHLNPEVAKLSRGFDTYIRSGYMRRAEENVERFLEWVDENEGKPFFAWLHIVDVHTPYQPPAPYDRLYYDRDEKDPRDRSLQKMWPLLPRHMSDHPFFRDWLAGITDTEWVIAQYKGAITYVDDQIGRLVDELEERGRLDQTGIIVTSDHGENLGDHDMYFVHTGLYDSTIHVPLITYFPGAEEVGVVVEDVVELVDVMPTALEYLGVAPPPRIRGRSLWPQVRGEDEGGERVAIAEHAGRNLVALRSARYKYIRHQRTKRLQPSYPFVRGQEELYDLLTDRRELIDISDDRPDVLERFREILRERREESFDMSIGQASLTGDTIEVLKALGYVQ